MKDNRVIRRRKMLYTLEQLSAELGCAKADIEALEDQFLSPLQRAYLAAVRYSVGYYPIRKPKQRRRKPAPVLKYPT